MSPVHSADTLSVQHFVEITLSRIVSEINALLRFTQKFKMAAKIGGKAISANSFQKTLWMYSAGQKFHQNLSILHRFRDKCAFVFYAEIQDGRQKWRESDFSEKSPIHSGHPGGQKFR